MATVRPFKAYRPQKKYADKVICLPYDVMNRKEAAEMASGNPLSFLHVTRADIDMMNKDEHSPEVYVKSRENFDKVIADGIFVQDEKPCIYIYRAVMDGRSQTGFFACVSVDEYKNGIIKRHELTRYEKELDRINHFDKCDANTEPVYLTYKDDKRIRAAVEKWTGSHLPEYNLTSIDGVRHMLWPVDDEDVIDTIVKAVKDIPYLYIADGHHRTASACAVADKRRKDNPGYTGDEEFNYILAAVFPDNELEIMDYNRVVRDLNGMKKDVFLKKIEARGFSVSEYGKEPYRPDSKRRFGMYLDGMWYKLEASKDIVPDDPIASLDVSVLQDNLLAPLLGIDDPRGSGRIDFVGGVRGLKELERRVNTDMAVAFSVYPVQIKDLMHVADVAGIMPPKSTWFEPKPASGLVIHHF